MSDSLHSSPPFNSGLEAKFHRAVAAKRATLPINSSISKDRTEGRKATEDASLSELTHILDKSTPIQRKLLIDTFNGSMADEDGGYSKSESESESEGVQSVQDYGQYRPPTPPPIDSMNRFIKASNPKALGEACEEHQVRVPPADDMATATTGKDENDHQEAVNIREGEKEPSKVYSTCARIS